MNTGQSQWHAQRPRQIGRWLIVLAMGVGLLLLFVAYLRLQ
jgi:hypothetical protein